MNATAEQAELIAFGSRSWKIGVKTTGDGDWGYNGLRFRTEAEAARYAEDLAFRWTAVRETQVVPSRDEPNYAIVDGALKRL